jgi:hypothetical protein
MRRFPLLVCLVLLLLVVIVIPVTASPEIYSISPSSGPNNGVVTVTIKGSDFNAQSTVWMSLCSTGGIVYGTVVSWSPTSMTCTFSLNGRTPGQYNVFVNSPFSDPLGNYYPQDSCEISQGFVVYKSTGTTYATTTPTGTTPPTPISAALPSYSSMSVSSTPSGANIYLDNEDKGLTTLTMNNITNGNHVVIIKLNGYWDWVQNVVVLGNPTSISATLIAIPAGTTGQTTTVTTPSTIVPTPTVTPTPPITVTTVQTTVLTTETTAPVVTTTPSKSTRSPTSKAALNIPTSWPTDTPAESSPLGIEGGIIATIGAAFLFIKRK